MKRSSIYFLLIISLLVCMSGCLKPAASTITTPDITGDSGFNFIFKYGVTAGNILDTFQNTFTKDMVTDPPITVALTFTQQEKDLIYRKMVEIGFFDFPADFNDRIPADLETTQIVTPGQRYYFKTQAGQTVKELNWDAGRIYEDQMSKDLESLTKLIIQIIEPKDEYKQIPQPTSGYA